MAAALAFIASLMFTMFASSTASAVGTTWTGGHGGSLGKLLGSAVLGALDKFPASVLFFVIALLSVFFAFGISPKVLMKLAGFFKRPEREEGGDTDLATLKARAAGGFNVNEGVPVEHHGVEKEPKLVSLKNSAQKLAPAEDHEALTTASDPDWKLPGVDLLNQKQDSRPW
jgi:hypothetical protein